MTTSSTPVRIVEETPAYWRVLFDNPPLNVVDGSVFEGLQELLSRMDASPDLRVVVFESANPKFYLAHFDMTGKSASIATAVGPSGLPIPTDAFVRLSKSPVVSIAKIEAASAVWAASSSLPVTCASCRARRRSWVNQKSGPE